MRRASPDDRKAETQRTSLAANVVKGPWRRTKRTMDAAELPSYGQVWMFEEHPWVVLGHTVTEHGMIWCTSWPLTRNGETMWYLPVSELRPAAAEMQAPLHVIADDLSALVVHDGDPGAMWWLGDLAEYGDEEYSACPALALAYYLAAIRRAPRYFGHNLGRVVRDGYHAFSPASQEPPSRSWRRVMSRFVEFRGGRSDDWVGPLALIYPRAVVQGLAARVANRTCSPNGNPDVGRAQFVAPG